MANIQITPELLEQKASEMRKLIENHQANMKAIDNLIMGLREIWKGEAQDQFLARHQSLQGEFQKFVTNLENYVALMNKAAAEFRATDTTLKSTMQSFG